MSDASLAASVEEGVAGGIPSIHLAGEFRSNSAVPAEAAARAHYHHLMHSEARIDS